MELIPECLCADHLSTGGYAYCMCSHHPTHHQWSMLVACDVAGCVCQGYFEAVDISPLEE